jgi:hypothetical protein
MTTITRDLLPRALPFLSPKAAALVTDFLMTEVRPNLDDLDDADTEAHDLMGRQYSLWRPVYHLLFSNTAGTSAENWLRAELAYVEQTENPNP